MSFIHVKTTTASQLPGVARFKAVQGCHVCVTNPNLKTTKLEAGTEWNQNIHIGYPLLNFSSTYPSTSTYLTTLKMSKVSLVLLLAVAYVAAMDGDEESNKIANDAWKANIVDGKPIASYCSGRHMKATLTVVSYETSATEPGITKYSMVVDISVPKSGSSEAFTETNKVFVVTKGPGEELTIGENPCRPDLS
ncbi:uncharacterized protein LOC129592175 [Paramacrobiotus metropolitanus]|uniref:uncharacterized protein LOC129592175 n=1 Tax=Paramacrobiotus metropolitanus TaxID=2943436 RepID=UPI00244619AA|nr:uncharacterized protein LOC129592175 [Paramacrobiotus metropolitanus]